MTNDFDAQYAAFTSTVGWCDCNDRTQIELTGDDRATFLHNFTTNDIRGLKPGGGCEAFALDARGHVLGHLLVFCTPHSLVIDTVPGQAETLCRHLDRYLIRERVEIHDRSEAWGEFALAGAEAGQLLHELTSAVLESPYSHTQVQLAGHQLWLRRVDIFGSGSYFLAGPRDAMDAIGLLLEAEGVVPCGQDVLEAVRIEAGFPWFGIDITAANLPQEVARDFQAINFKKGCYLGQETVARIDALGHVNKTLACVHFSGSQIPPSGTELRSGDQPAGTLTSATFSPLLSAPLALAYLRRSHNTLGAKVTSDLGDGTVIAIGLENLCPVCGFDLGFKPWNGTSASDEICPCCGLQFGYDDMAGGGSEQRKQIYSDWRERWIKGGMIWDEGRAAPSINWDPIAQLKRIGIKV